MKEFWIYKHNGSSYIEYAQDISEISRTNHDIIEEIDNDYSNERKTLSYEAEKYYESFFKTEEEKKIDLLLENQKSLSDWSKKFIFGLKKNISKGLELSIRQKEILNTL